MILKNLGLRVEDIISWARAKNDNLSMAIPKGNKTKSEEDWLLSHS